ncbi:Crocetin glucosyltransferase, chloroplastic [Ananas comosus]|uniref:Glycosyltransferase n=1 Tax=Ananas comosus TaxID=4615 RepID=A0A199VKM4_ANACO|nr:Crocetin glucosyltransferase, chloroplastic [Ananas comosus]
MEQLRRQQQHFLVVTYPAQGHINPSQHLARRLARSTGARVTFSTAVSAHRRMFPSLSSPDQEFSDGLLSYIPYSDGSDDGIKRSSSNNNKDAAADNPMLRLKQVGTRTLSAVLDRLSARDERVTCVVYTILLPWVADVARAHGVPAVLCWIQPATVLAIYYHYFHGYDGVVAAAAAAHASDPAHTVTLPGLAPLRIRDLPSFLATTSEDDPYAAVLDDFRETFDAIERGDDGADAAGGKTTVLVNTFDALEPNALKSVEDLNLIAVGPVIPSLAALEGGAAESKDLFAPDEKHYMEWLDGKAEGSVVYVSFGSMSMVKKRQMEEMRKGLKESGRPYLWVVRKDNKEAESIEPEEPDQQGMVVEWCSQVRVLNHAAVGCFVTHCGWNSTVESVAAGVPTVCVPQWTDQGTNAWLMAEEWGMGVRGEINGEGLLEGEELRRCLEVVMGEGERGAEIRRRAQMWKDKAREAIGDGGSSQRNLRAFVNQIANRN